MFSGLIFKNSVQVCNLIMLFGFLEIKFSRGLAVSTYIRNKCNKNKAKATVSFLEILTAEGRTPPSAVYRESFPTGIPIPW